MSLASRVSALVTQIAADYKDLKAYAETQKGDLLNSSFEFWDNATNPKHWNVGWASSTNRSQTTGRRGNKAFRMTWTVTGNQRFYQPGATTSPGQWYYWEMWIRPQAGSLSMNVKIVEGTDPNLGPFSSFIKKSTTVVDGNITAPTGVWTKLKGYHMVTHAEATYVQPEFYFNSAGAGQLDIDDFTFVPVEDPSPLLVPEISGTLENKNYYEKYPDGRLICRGIHSFPSNASTGQSYAWTYPVPFVGALPHITASSETSAVQNCSVGYTSNALDSSIIRFYRSTAAATNVLFQAEGRWR